MKYNNIATFSIFACLVDQEDQTEGTHEQCMANAWDPKHNTADSHEKTCYPTKCSPTAIATPAAANSSHDEAKNKTCQSPSSNKDRYSQP